MAIYAPCDFTAINNYPHAIPEKAIEKLPSFKEIMLFQLKCISKLL
jgi:hypothetical protein